MDYRALLPEVAKLQNLLLIHAQLMDDAPDSDAVEAAQGLEHVIDNALRVVGAFADSTFVPVDDGIRYDMRPDRR